MLTSHVKVMWSGSVCLENVILSDLNWLIQVAVSMKLVGGCTILSDANDADESNATF